MMFSGPPSPPTCLRGRGPAASCRTAAASSVKPMPEQRVHRERGVPHPGVAVVPVALAADLLGQPRRRRRDQRAGRGVGHQLQRDRRPLDGLAPASGVRRLRQPAAPEGRRSRRTAAGTRRWRISRGGPQRRDSSTSPRTWSACSDKVSVTSPSAVDGSRRTAARRPGSRTACRVSDRSPSSKTTPCSVSWVSCARAPVVEPRRDRRPRSPSRPRTHRTIRTSRWLSVGRPAGQRHEVEHLADAVLGEEAGDQDRGVREVELLAGVVARRPG